MRLIGRKQEQDTFKHCLDSTESKLIALYGRRRVGKTFLVRNYFKNKIQFEVAGLYDGNLTDQLEHFATTLAKYGWRNATLQTLTSWKTAFTLLEDYLDSLNSKQKKVIFLDELPWFDTPKSKFLMAFESFWNGYCTKRNDLVVIICGSAASWMIKKILKNKGGLHNRVSEKIRLTQFNLSETAAFLKEKGIKWSPYDIAQLYMTTGGVPYYLDAIRKGESIAQFVDRTCFTKDGILVEEYQVLFQSLFDNSHKHYKVVEALYDKKQGLSRTALIKKTKLPSGGSLTNILHELEESGFIEDVIPYQKNKTKSLYKLVDNFTIFYLKFMNGKTTAKWMNLVKTQSWISWSGLAFERVCSAHIPQIKKALKLEAIASSTATWQSKQEEQGAQIDLLVDRADRVVNICEIKFSNADFRITKDYARKLRNKLYLFASLKSSKRKTLFLTMVTTFGTVQNEYYKELVQSEVTLEDLFQ